MAEGSRQSQATPLAGIRVLDLSRIFAGPYCAQTLADLGAEVIKVERPVAGDEIRNYGPPFLRNREGGNSRESSYYIAANRNKKSITVDLATEKGRDLILRLAAISDILIENYKVGDLKRRGLDYESVRKVNPRIIYASITGYGQEGPYKNRPGLDGCFQAMSGLMSLTGDRDRPPQRAGVIVSDTITSLFTTVAILGALYHRNMNGGPGQYLDMALLDSQVAAMSHRATEYLISGQVPLRQGNSTPTSFPSDLFQAADGWVFISAAVDAQFERLMKVIGRSDVFDTHPQYRTRAGRLQDRERITRIIGEAMAKKGMQEWMDAFAEGDVIAAPAYTLDRTFEDPHVRHRDILMQVPHEDSATGTVPILRSPIRMSETPIKDYKRPPFMGEHTDEVLKGTLGLDEAEIEKLRGQGTI